MPADPVDLAAAREWLERNPLAIAIPPAVESLASLLARVREEGRRRPRRWVYPESERPRAPLCCYDCLRPYSELEDTTVADDVWTLISPTGDGGGILCNVCMAQRLKAIGLWRVPAEFGSGGAGALVAGGVADRRPIRVRSLSQYRQIAMPPDETIDPQPPSRLVEAAVLLVAPY